MAMNFPTLIVLLLIAAALFLALWLNRRSGRKLTDCGSGCGSCRGCDNMKKKKVLGKDGRFEN